MTSGPMKYPGRRVTLFLSLAPGFWRYECGLKLAKALLFLAIELGFLKRVLDNIFYIFCFYVIMVLLQVCTVKESFYS